MFSQECFASIPPIPYRDSEIDVEKFNIIEDMDKVMFGRPQLLFKVKLRKYSGNKIDIFEVPLVLFSAFERVQLETDDQMHQMGDIIQLYEPGPLPALEPILHVGFLRGPRLMQSSTDSLLHGRERASNCTTPLCQVFQSVQRSRRQAHWHWGWQQAVRGEHVDVEIRARNAKISHSGWNRKNQRSMQLLCKVQGTHNKKTEPQLWMNTFLVGGMIKQMHSLQCFAWFHIISYIFICFHNMFHNSIFVKRCEIEWNLLWPIFCFPFHRSILHSILQWSAKSELAETSFHIIGPTKSLHIVSHGFI